MSFYHYVALEIVNVIIIVQYTTILGLAYR
jgi:hypothetical protein